jgi:hypothetical protein
VASRNSVEGVSALFVGLKVLHVVAVVVGFGPLFVYPAMLRQLPRHGSTEPMIVHTVVGLIGGVRRQISERAFLAVGPLGLLTATQHPDDDVFTRLWVHLAIPLWLISTAVILFVHRPFARRVSECAEALARGDANRAAALPRRVAWLTRVTWVSWAGLVGMVLLMITRPS